MKKNSVTLIIMAFVMIAVSFAACNNKPVKVTGVSVNPEKDTLKINDYLSIVATVSPADADDKLVTWTSDNSVVAEVDNNGKVTAKSVGTTNITCKTNDGGFKAITKITVIDESEDYAQKIAGTYIGAMSMAGSVVEEAARIDVNYLSLNRVELTMNQTLNVAGMPIPIVIDIACESDVTLVGEKPYITTTTTFAFMGAEWDVKVDGSFDDDSAHIIIHVEQLNINVIFDGKRELLL
ncbi:MAG: Ig-like domain-containing protein [Bacteroidales bacterium]|jgi:hypothetical protein|nr:Ig-like domain-containing protein [Bacteroidales bacterium]